MNESREETEVWVKPGGFLFPETLHVSPTPLSCRCGLVNRSVTRTGSSASTCPPQTVNLCAVTSSATSVGLFTLLTKC